MDMSTQSIHRSIDSGEVMPIADLDYKVQGAIRAKATRVICPLRNALDYDNNAGPDHRSRSTIKVIGVRNIVELLQVSLMHSSSPPLALYPDHEINLPLSQGCFQGSSWGPTYIHTPGSPPKGWHQKVICMCVPARKPEYGALLRGALCHPEHVSAYARAKNWAKNYSHMLKHLTPLCLDCAHKEYDFIYSMPPTATKKGVTPFSAVIHLATVSMLTGWEYHPMVWYSTVLVSICMRTGRQLNRQ